VLQFYGWLDPRRGYLVSREPPDNPVRPALAFESADEAVATIKRKRGVILWSPALPKGLLNAGQS
jgi:hypothetical protein